MSKSLVATFISFYMLLSLCGCTSNTAGTVDREAFFSGASLGEYDANDFRNAKWHMSSQEVQSVEGGEDKYPGEDMLTYDVEVCGIKCTADYLFWDDKLMYGYYDFYSHHNDKTGYIDDFNVIKASLDEKYGESAYYKEYDLAHTSGKVESFAAATDGYRSVWVSGHNIITLTMSIEPAKDSQKSLYDTDIYAYMTLTYSPFFTDINLEENPFVGSNTSASDGL